MRSSIFRDMRSAPMDGSLVEVRHGPDEAVGLAYWAGQNQAWVLDDDRHRKSLHQVTGWRPVSGKPGKGTVSPGG
jgi:hypothetical protein